MSKKIAAWDALGEAMLPSDFDTPTEGSNYGLDGYPDLDYGAGVLDGNTFGEPRLETNLPDGIVLEPETDHLASEFGETGTDMGDISSFLKEAGLTDLSWLELADQDPDRLPKNPVNLSIPELEEAWGKNRRTDGVRMTMPNVDRTAATYEASLLQDAGAPSAEKKAHVADMVRLASRQVTAGVDFTKVARALVARLGHDAPMAKDAMLTLREDAGLLGRVFIRASHYPGCANGTWTEPVRKHAAEAPFVVEKKACGGCVHAQDGSCSVFKKRLVAKVPWIVAAQHFSPMLRATGRPIKVAHSLDDLRANLKDALAQEPRGMSRVGDTRPVATAPADTITTQDARVAFDAMPVVTPHVVAASREEVKKRVAGWHARGMLKASDAVRLLQSEASTTAVLKAAMGLITLAKSGSYSGGMNAGKMGYDADPATVLASLAMAEKQAQDANAFIQAEMARRVHADSREGRAEAQVEAKVAKVVQAVDKGLCGRALIAHVLRTFEASERGLAATLLDPVFKQKNALAEKDHTPRKYAGDGVSREEVQVVTASEAWARLRDVLPPPSIGTEFRQRALVSRQRALVSSLGRWVRDGLLSKEAAHKLAQSTAPPQEVLRIAARMIGRVKMAQYSGIANTGSEGADVSPEQAWALLASAEKQHTLANQQIQAELAKRAHAVTAEGIQDADIRSKVAAVEAEIKRGVRGSVLRNFIRRTITSGDALRAAKYLVPLLKKTGAHEDVAHVASQYEGAAFEAHQPRKASDGATTPEVGRLVKWARVQMSEGFAGRDLDELISHRFGAATRKAASTLLEVARKAHEGLAGHVYVDAAAYASEAGTTGCEAGGLKHRANAVPAVLQMSRCGSCAQRATLKNGSAVCRVYNKGLVASAGDAIEGGDAKSYQRETIKLANATDAEHTASLFSPAYDPGEFGLSHPAEFDDIPIDEEAEFEPLEGIAFGGMNWE